MTISPVPSSGGCSSYDEFYRQYFPRVRMLVARHFATCDAEEIAQETMSRIYANFATIDPARDPWPWVSSVARNAAIDSMRRTARIVFTDDLPEPVEHGFDTTYDAALVSERCRTVRLALSRLRPAERQLIEDRDLEGLDYAVMAEVRDISQNTLRQQLRRARIRLAFELRRAGANLGVVPVAVQLRLTRLSRRLNDLSAGVGPAGASALSVAAVAGAATVATFVGGPAAAPVQSSAPLVLVAPGAVAPEAANATQSPVAPTTPKAPARTAPVPYSVAPPAVPDDASRTHTVGPVTVRSKGNSVTKPHDPYEDEVSVPLPNGERISVRHAGEASPGSGLTCDLNLRKCPPRR